MIGHIQRLEVYRLGDCWMWLNTLLIADVINGGLHWRAHWPNLITLFDFPADIRKVIYTTNAIESLNSAIRNSVKTRKLFPSDDSAKKVIFLAIQQASKKWTMPIQNWKTAMNHFMIVLEEQLAPPCGRLVVASNFQ